MNGRKRVSVYAQPQTVSWLEHLASSTGTTRAQVIEECVAMAALSPELLKMRLLGRVR